MTTRTIEDGASVSILHLFNSYLADVQFRGYNFYARESRTGALYLQGEYMEADTVTGEDALQKTRRWILTPHMSKSEVVSTAFLCVMTSMEHQVREWFTYQGKAIYMPHYNVDELAAICDQRETR